MSACAWYLLHMWKGLPGTVLRAGLLHEPSDAVAALLVIFYIFILCWLQEERVDEYMEEVKEECPDTTRVKSPALIKAGGLVGEGNAADPDALAAVADAQASKPSAAATNGSAAAAEHPDPGADSELFLLLTGAIGAM